MSQLPELKQYNSLHETTDIFAVSQDTPDIFAYAMPNPISPKPTVASRIKPPHAGGAMKPILPTLGQPAKLPSPIPPPAAVPTPSPHPEVPAKPQVPKAMRSGNLDTLQQRIPRPPKPRYRLQVPLSEAFNRAHDEILGEMNSVTHPEDKERYQEAIDDLEKVYVSGSERLMTRFLEDHVGWKTFNHLVQSLKDEEPAMTSRKGLFSKTDEHNRREVERLTDIFRYAKGRWITIGGNKGGDGVRHGGSPVYVENGRITKGHPGLTGKKISALGERAEGSSVRTANKQEAEYGRAKWLKKARQEGVDPKGLSDLAGEIKAHHDAYGDDIRSLRADVFKAYPHLKSATLSADRGGDSAGIKNIDRISQSYAQSGKFNHLFGGYDADAFRVGETGPADDYSERLYEYLVNTPPEPMSETDAYEQAFEHIKSTKAANEANYVPFAKHTDIFRYGADPEAAIATGPTPPPVASADRPTKPTPPKVKAVSPQYRPPADHAIPDRIQDSWWHDVPHTNWLKHGEEIGRTGLRRGINSAWKIKLAGEHPGQSYHGIWKAADKDQTYLARPNVIPDGNPHGHEAAAWELAHLIGLGDMVPPTVSRTNRGQIGSVQHFVPGQHSAFESPDPFGKQMPLAAAYDALTLNTDRHMGNWLVDPKSGKLALIDNGLSFPQTHKNLQGTSEILGKTLRSGIPVPAAAVEWQEHWPIMERAMRRNGLTDEQIALTGKRLESLAAAAKAGDSFAKWLNRSGIGSGYLLR